MNVNILNGKVMLSVMTQIIIVTAIGMVVTAVEMITIINIVIAVNAWIPGTMLVYAVDHVWSMDIRVMVIVMMRTTTAAVTGMEVIAVILMQS